MERCGYLCEGGRTYSIQPRLLQEGFSLLAGTLPAVTISSPVELQFLPLFLSWQNNHMPVEYIMHFKIFLFFPLKNINFNCLLAPWLKIRMWRIRFHWGGSHHWVIRFFFPEYTCSQFPFILCLMYTALPIFQKSLPTGCLNMEWAVYFFPVLGTRCLSVCAGPW